jgi:hypothetical protein
MKIAKLDTAHPAARRVLICCLDRIVSNLLCFFLRTSQSASATSASSKPAAAPVAEEGLEVGYFVGGGHGRSLLMLPRDLVG